MRLNSPGRYRANSDTFGAECLQLFGTLLFPEVQALSGRPRLARDAGLASLHLMDDLHQTAVEKSSKLIYHVKYVDPTVL